MTFALPNMFGRNFYLLKQNFSRPLAKLQLRFPQFNFKKVFPIFLLGLIALVVIGVVTNIGYSAATKEDTRIEIKSAKATQTINKEYAFPLKDAKGTVVTTIKYTIEGAELRDEIVVKGQRASAVKGRTFLIVPVKITNEYSQSIDMQSKDYIRLTVNGAEGEQLAADIHSDPVTVQALSTKSTRLGFPINDTDTKLTLKVGELNGTKETIEITLK